MNYPMFPGFHSFGPAAMGFGGPFFGGIFTALIIIAVVWTLVWKGLALWQAARNHQKAWFIVLLIVNTLGILEIIYLLFFRQNKNNLVTTTTVTHTVTASTPLPDASAPAADVGPAGPTTVG